MSYFCKKRKHFLAFFSQTPYGVTNFNTSPIPSLAFEKFLSDALNSKQKPSVKNQSTGRATGEDFEIYRSGRESPAGSISGMGDFGKV